jgi:hypothetical protein
LEQSMREDDLIMIAHYRVTRAFEDVDRALNELKILFEKQGKELYQTQEIEKPPTLSYSDECSVCLVPLNPSTTTVGVCGHGYHKACLAEWFRNSTLCPMCRRIFRLPNCFTFDKVGLVLRLPRTSSP